jgi:hypothetical protein
MCSCRKLIHIPKSWVGRWWEHIWCGDYDEKCGFSLFACWLLIIFHIFSMCRILLGLKKENSKWGSMLTIIPMLQYCQILESNGDCMTWFWGKVEGHLLFFVHARYCEFHFLFTVLSQVHSLWSIPTKVGHFRVLEMHYQSRMQIQ